MSLFRSNQLTDYVTNKEEMAAAAAAASTARSTGSDQEESKGLSSSGVTEPKVGLSEMFSSESLIEEITGMDVKEVRNRYMKDILDAAEAKADTVKFHNGQVASWPTVFVINELAESIANSESVPLFLKRVEYNIDGIGTRLMMIVFDLEKNKVWESSLRRLSEGAGVSLSDADLMKVFTADKYITGEEREQIKRIGSGSVWASLEKAAAESEESFIKAFRRAFELPDSEISDAMLEVYSRCSIGDCIRIGRI